MGGFNSADKHNCSHVIWMHSATLKWHNFGTLWQPIPDRERMISIVYNHWTGLVNWTQVFFLLKHTLDGFNWL